MIRGRARALLVVVVAAAYGLIASTAFLGPPPLSVVLPVLLVYAALVTLGVSLLNLGVFVDVVSRGSRDRSLVALTFDDGPHPIHTPVVLAALEAAGQKATFFVVGRKVDDHPDVVRAIAQHGHEVGLHGYDHDRLLSLRPEPRIIDDLERTRAAVERACGVAPHIFRPPVGVTSPRIAVAVRALGLDVIGWSARAFDGVGQPSAARVLARLEPGLSAGAIVLLHDAAERGDRPPASIEALQGILEALARHGLRSVTVSDLLKSPSDSRGKPRELSRELPAAGGE